MNTAAVLLFLMAVTALAMDAAGVRVPCPQCAADPTLGLLGRSWFAWGALFYAVAGTAAAVFRKNAAVPVVIAAGVVFHLWLVRNGFYGEKVVCLLCYGFLAAEVAALLAYVFAGELPLKCRRWWANAGVLILAAAVFWSGTGQDGSPAQAGSTGGSPGALTPAGETVTARVYSGKQDVTEEGDSERTVSSPVIRVRDENGAETELDLSIRPALFFAWWHPRTTEALKAVAPYGDRFMPYLVSVRDRGRKEYAVQKLVEAGVKGRLYFIDEGVTGRIPALVWYSGGKPVVVDPASLESGPPVLLSSARIPVGSGNGAKNAVLAARAIDGTVIPPGGVFSFNQTVGQRTPERGYLPSEVIVSGPDGPVRTEGVGGGICRTATVLHLAVKSAGLEVLEAKRHSLPVSYGGGDDVAVAWPDLDYKFRNTSGGYLKIVVRELDGEIEVGLFACRPGLEG